MKQHSFTTYIAYILSILVIIMFFACCSPVYYAYTRAGDKWHNTGIKEHGKPDRLYDLAHNEYYNGTWSAITADTIYLNVNHYYTYKK